MAIDDMRAGFEGYEAQLVHCQIGMGLGDKDVQKLFADRLATMFGTPGLVPESGMPGAPVDGDR
ncbi:hypothetical protein PTKU64_53710 [Paraburkholderia terrae]|uniref:Uncharacterized protein n=1 Tax=Paraburkholderia terrae TaxID=311230 RepID=A0ABM7TSR6_9BURK|nr:hypothetical protein PTKU64_53710 [Paraburkholderia terrae]